MLFPMAVNDELAKGLQILSNRWSMFHEGPDYTSGPATHAFEVTSIWADLDYRDVIMDFIDDMRDYNEKNLLRPISKVPIMNTFEEICQFVVEQRWEYDFPLTRETTLRKDLSLGGDDAAEFIENYGKRFKVDLNKFIFDNYFPPEGDFILRKIIGVLFSKKDPDYIPITLGDLEEAAKKGKWM